MKIIVFGASGGTGREIVKLALQQGHEVTAFVRSKQRLLSRFGWQVEPNELRMIEGDALNAQAVSSALRGQEAVISALGGNGLSAAPVMYQMVQHIIAGMQQHDIKRIVYCASAGVHKEIPAPAGWIVGWILRHVLTDHRQSYELLVNAGLEWTLARPMRLSDGEARGTYRRAIEGIPRAGQVIARADVAHFMLECVTERKHIRESVGLAY